MPAVKKEKRDSKKSKTKICSQNKVKKAINGLKLLEEKFVEKDLKKQPLLENETESLIFLQIILKKIPPPQLLKMIGVSLPHSLITETSEVCLITGDLEKRNHKAEVEPTVLYYKDLLKKHDVTNVAQVIPLRQLRTEYKTYESKRQLAAAYDVFLVDKKIAGVLPKTLGKSFFQGRKFPIQIDMRRLNLKDQINKALCQTKFSLSCRGNSYSLEIARLSMENDAILENVMAAIKVLANKLPGKENNILSLYLKTAKSKAIPIYVSLDISDDILIKKPRKNESVGHGELSTMDDAEVKVFRDGRVIVKKGKKNSSTSGDTAEDNTNTNLNEPFSGDELVENEEDTQESTVNKVSLKKKKKKGSRFHKNEKVGPSELTTVDDAEVKVFQEERANRKRGKKNSTTSEDNTNTNLNEPLSGDLFVENEDTQESTANEVSLKKKKKGSKSKIHRNISEVVEVDINVKTPKSKKEKKTKDVIDAAKKETSLTFIEDKEIIQNEKTPSRSKRVKKESTEISTPHIISSLPKRKRPNDVKNNLKSNERQKRHKHTYEN